MRFLVSDHCPSPLSLISQVVMKIVKHAREHPRQSVDGSLLGLASAERNVVEVTNCFPQPVFSEEETQESSK